MAIKKKAVLLAVFLVIAMLAMVGTASAAPIELIGPEGLELSTPYEATHWGQVWDLTKGDLTLSYTIDMNNVLQPGTWQTYNRTTLYAEVGLRGEGAQDFNPGRASDTYQGSCGGYMVSDDDTCNDGDVFTESGNPNPDGIQDLDDKHSLSASPNRGERDYDVLDRDGVFGYDAGWDVVGPTRPDPYAGQWGTPLDAIIGAYGSWNNEGIWWDRDGVDQWQSTKYANTRGIYDIVLVFHAIDANGNGDKTDDGLGVVFATVNGLPQGFYADPANWDGTPDYIPAGLSFKGDMEHMQVFAGVWGPNWDAWAIAQYGLSYFDYGSVTLSKMTVEGTPGISDPLVADFTHTFDTDVLSPGDTVSFADASHGGMDPYTYNWNFGDGATSTDKNPTHVYAAPGTYDVTLTVTPFRCMPKTITKTITVYETGYLNVIKYYDANVNGVRDPGEMEIPGWKFTIAGKEYLTPATLELPVGDYTVTEVMPLQACWMSTTATSFDVTVRAAPAPGLEMYADDFTVGAVVGVNFDPYNPDSQVDRLNPSNALGPFDAVAPAGVSDYFFATGARTWSHYTFAGRFLNVDGAPDIEFAEVTWSTGGSWHTEAMKVYLTGATVRDAAGNLVPYGATDDGIGYYAGIAWNRIGLEYVTAADRLAVTEGYFAGARDFADNVFYRNGPYRTYTQFHLPDEVVCAEGVYLVDVTKDVYDMAYPASYLDVSGTGALVTLGSAAWDVINYNQITSADVSTKSPSNGNTDGYDLDAIRVYRCETVEFGNVCLGAGGGLTPGFWSNKNGEKAFNTTIGTVDALAALVALDLWKYDKKTGTLSEFNPTTYAVFKAWLQARDAVDMRYQLSAHLAAMTLNVMAGFVDGDALVYAGPLGPLTVNELMAKANTALGAAQPDSAYLEQLKNALDKANNNYNFLQAGPCAFSY